MSRFPGFTSADSDASLQALYDDILAHGFGDQVPINFFTALAVRPDILSVTWQLTKALLVNGSLPGSLKQMIALSISRQNNCRYCAVVHQGALEAAGVEHQIVEACATDPGTVGLTEPYRSIVQFALRAARDPARLTDEDFAALREHGLASEEIAEVVMMAGFTNFINAWADISGIPLDSATS